MACLCGCGQKPKLRSKFVSGHNSRVKSYCAGQFQKGNLPWNNGLTKDTDIRVFEVARKSASNPNILKALRKGGRDHAEAVRGKTWEDIFGTEEAGIRKKQYSESNSGKGNGFYGKKHSEESIAKRTEKRLHPRIIKFCGYCGDEFEVIDTSKRKFCSHLCYWNHRKDEKYWSWGGRSVSDYPEEFNRELKYSIRKRYGFICAMCHQHKSLAVHHWEKNKMNSHIMNLVPVCNSCHGKIHGWKMDFTEDIQKAMKEYDMCFTRGYS